jgi:hypothetical protein
MSESYTFAVNLEMVLVQLRAVSEGDTAQDGWWAPKLQEPRGHNEDTSGEGILDTLSSRT